MTFPRTATTLCLYFTGWGLFCIAWHLANGV